MHQNGSLSLLCARRMGNKEFDALASLTFWSKDSYWIEEVVPQVSNIVHVDVLNYFDPIQCSLSKTKLVSIIFLSLHE